MFECVILGLLLVALYDFNLHKSDD